MNGIYSVKFGAGGSIVGSGVALISGSNVYGGDGIYYYKGQLNADGEQVNGTLNIKHHAGTPDSIFGPVEEFGLTLHGTIKEGQLRLEGHVTGLPSQKIRIAGHQVDQL